MAFQKGDKNINRAGRPPKAGNKTLETTREVIRGILNDSFTRERVIADLKALKPVDRLNVQIKLMEFTIPKMRSVDLDISGLSDSQAEYLLNELKAEVIRNLNK